MYCLTRDLPHINKVQGIQSMRSSQNFLFPGEKPDGKQSVTALSCFTCNTRIAHNYIINEGKQPQYISID